MRRLLAGLLSAALAASAALPAHAETKSSDPIGDLVATALNGVAPILAEVKLKATLYHAGAKGVRALDSLGCHVIAMRTAAIDNLQIPRGTILFIKETVGMIMPDGSKHDGYWYATDTGGAIKGDRIDLYTGDGKASMKQVMGLNLADLTVTKAGTFNGCPPLD